MSILVAASGNGAARPLQTALAALGFGALFGGVGVVLVTNFRGLAHRWIESSDESLQQVPVVGRPLRRFNIWLFGSEANFANHKFNVMPKIVGTAFVVMGSVVFITGVVRLLLLMA